MLVFEKRGKLENPEKDLSEVSKEPRTNFTHIWPRVRNQTRATLVASAITTTPSLLSVEFEYHLLAGCSVHRKSRIITIINFLLTEREGRTREYWPEVRTKRPRANILQYGLG